MKLLIYLSPRAYHHLGSKDNEDEIAGDRICQDMVLLNERFKGERLQKNLDPPPIGYLQVHGMTW